MSFGNVVSGVFTPVLANTPSTPESPDCDLYNREDLPASPSDFLMTTAKVSTSNLRIPSFRYNFGTTEREKKRVSDP